ncbi:Protein C3orf33 [Bagarius yarrelli]|uniref:Protein C3orf33 n=1 Tax=Bagarius yarrelli TaxID=175774 RepID=A0A556TQP6_BAGYA|nr:Protein C3orf33 [Bagarius yarrelli]
MSDSCIDRTDNDKKQSINIITVISKFADENLTLVRSISTGLAVAGVIITARSIRLLTKFGSPSEIPVRFIERNVSIRGKVRSVTEKGLEVEHIPIYVPLLSPLLTKRQVTTPLCVHLAGVDVTPEGRDWLCETLGRDEPVWLRLIGREDENLHCLVSLSRRLLFNPCINEQILRLGLGRTAPLCGIDPNSRIYWRLQARLLKCEHQAERKGQGLWKQESLREKLTQAYRKNSVITALKRILNWVLRTKDKWQVKIADRASVLLKPSLSQSVSSSVPSPVVVFQSTAPVVDLSPDALWVNLLREKVPEGRRSSRLCGEVSGFGSGDRVRVVDVQLSLP